MNDSVPLLLSPQTGKVKANRKRLKKRGYKFKEASSSATNSTAAVDDVKVMQFFTLPAEYAFVARALSQMDGVGRSLDPDFDFVSSAAPWIYEIKGVEKYLREEAAKWLNKIADLIEGALAAIPMKK